MSGRRDAWDLALTAVAEALVGPCAVPVGARVAVACSGGVDSTALVALLACLRDRDAPRGAWSGPLGPVLFVDHGLRDVAEERAAARAAAERAGVAFDALVVDVPTRGNLQAQARRARYAALVEALPPEALLATAHTATDQAETVVARAMRGAGARGLSGIPWRRGRIVRPLLRTEREQVVALGIDHALDPTNETPRFERNRLRAWVMPGLVAARAGAVSGLAEVAARAGGETALTRSLLSAAEEGLGVAWWRHVLDATEPRLRPAVALELLAALVAARWPNRPAPHRAALAEGAARILAGQGKVSLGSGVVLRVSDDALELRLAEDPRHRVVAPGPGTYLPPAATFRAVVAASSSPPAVPAPELAGRRTWLAHIPEPNLSWPLTIVGRPAPRSSPYAHSPDHGDGSSSCCPLALRDGLGRAWPWALPSHPPPVAKLSGVWIVVSQPC